MNASARDELTPLSGEELRNIDGFWRACNYLAAGMIYLRDNPLLKEPLKEEDIKSRLLGHWGASPGLSFMYTHVNRLIRKHEQEAIFLAGPGHGAPGVLAPVYLEGSYSEIYPSKSEDEEGMRAFFKQFSFPGGIGSHCTPETPGSIHEGGELGYSISHGFGAAFDNPKLLVVVAVGDGEAETGPLATSWHSSKFLNAARDGAVLPILHLNGYKINNPTLLSRIPNEELEMLMKGYGWTPHFVEGHDPLEMHQKMAATMDACYARDPRLPGRSPGQGRRPGDSLPLADDRAAHPQGLDRPQGSRWQEGRGFLACPPGAALRHAQQPGTPQTARRLDEELQARGVVRRERQVEARAPRHGSARAHAHERQSPRQWRADPPRACACRISASMRANWNSREPSGAMNTKPLGSMLRDVMRDNMTNFRVFGPDENTSNKLDDIYEVSKKLWLSDYLPEDADGGELSPDGRVMEMLSEHTLEGWYEGYVLTGRHGFFATYEAFVHVIDSMYNQHAKWLSICNEIPWRAPISSVNLLITSTVWRQDHNGFTHQDPGFLDVVLNKDPGSHPHLPAAGRQLPALGRQPLPQEHQLHQRDRGRQAEPSAVPEHGRGHQALHQGRGHLGLGQQRRGLRAGRRHGRLRRHPDQGGPGRHCNAAQGLSTTSRSASSMWWI